MRGALPLVSRALLLVALAAARARGDDATQAFSSSLNPAGAWRYGWAAVPGGAFQPFPTHSPTRDGVSQWTAANGASISQHCFGSPVYRGGVTQPTATLTARPSTTAAAVLRWTAPAAGAYAFHLKARALGGLPFPRRQVLDGGQQAGWFGSAVAICDVNADGYADLLVGQPKYSNGQSEEGRVVLYPGGPAGIGSTPSWTYESNQVNAHLGSAVAAIGDVNADGFPDFAVGAPDWDQGTPDNGVLYAFHGSASGPRTTPNWSRYGNTGQHLGTVFGDAGDVNGDGYEDLVLGSATPVLMNGSSVWVYFGSSTGLGAVWQGQSPVQNGTAYGSAVAGAGDIDGDGYDDLLVGDPRWDSPAIDAGRVFLYRGGPSSPVFASQWSCQSDTAGTLRGTSVAGAGDVNGDGYADILIGEPNYGSDQRGRAFLYLGSATGPASVPIWTSLGGSANEHDGMRVAGIGDVDRDGLSDCAVELGGGPWLSVWFGRSTGGLGPVPRLLASSQNDGFGTAFAGRGDINGDTYDDLAIGAYAHDSTLTDQGRVTLEYDLGPPPQTTSLLYVMSGTDTLTYHYMQTDDPTPFRFSVTRTLAAGQPIDFVVDEGNDNPICDAVSLDVTVLAAAANTSGVGPAMELDGQRFAVSRGPQAFETVAFDPADRTLYTQGHIRDLCGTQDSPGPPGTGGLTWDPVSQGIWSFEPDGMGGWRVYRFTPPSTLTLVFSIPHVIMVPGVGLDTLDAPRGIAADSSAVYVVDAGTAGGAPTNEWLKFSRAGTPLAVRRGANFAVNASSDAVDDVCYVPAGAPYAARHLLVAVEHTGIYELDLDGALVGTTPWGALAPAEQAARPVAFSGLSIDPVSGDLYLVDNDAGRVQVWSRLGAPGVASYVVGTGSDRAYLHAPGGCNDELLRPLASAGFCGTPNLLVFGLAYRSADARVYGVDFGAGDLWRFEPLTGKGERVGALELPSIWGLAYDRDRDLFYGSALVTGGVEIVALDPRTLDTSPVTPAMIPYGIRDLAYDRATGAIYGVDLGATARLIRVDRGSGAARVVGPTADASGLDFDSQGGNIVAMGCCSDTLWSIDPATGGTSVYSLTHNTGGWEGLAIVTTVPASAVDAPIPPTSRRPLRLCLAAGPNPTRGGMRFRLALPWPASPELAVFDLSGRVVRRLDPGTLAAGEHVIAWDGNDRDARPVPPGAYFIRAAAGGAVGTARVVKLE